MVFFGIFFLSFFMKLALVGSVRSPKLIADKNNTLQLLKLERAQHQQTTTAGESVPGSDKKHKPAIG